MLDPPPADAATSWRFALLNALPNHLIAIAARTGGAPLTLRLKQTVPMGKTVMNQILAAISGLDLLK